MTIPAPDLRPEAFLRHAHGNARGFWAKGDRWVAHRGVTAEIRGDGSSNADRFEEVATAARELALDPLLPEGTARAPRVRYYGGFSFRPDHEASGVWADFPNWLFHIPEFELEGEDGDAWLRVRTLVSRDSGDDVLLRLRHRAEALRAELTAHGDRPISAGPRVSGKGTSTDRGTWELAVMESLGAIRNNSISKAVLARTLVVELSGSVDPVDIVSHLWEVSRGSYAFLFEPVPGSTLLGAAPETVATLRDGVFHATAVAGSIRRLTHIHI